MAAAPETLDAVLDRLERVIGRLADPAAPLERLVADYREATGLVAAAREQLDLAARRATGAPGAEDARG